MGSRTTDTVREIERLRRNLDVTLGELEKRLPPAAQWSKRALGLVGGGTGGAVLLFAARKARSRRTRARRAESSPVTVKVFGGAAVPALGVAAIWAGVRLAEAKMRADAAARAIERPVAPVRTFTPQSERRA